MLRLSAIIAFFAISVFFSVLAWALLEIDPSTDELDADIAKIRQEIAITAAESDKYSSGVIKILIDLRAEMLRQSDIMLSQKRASVLRRIQLVYTIKGRELQPASLEELGKLQRDIEANEKTLAQSKNHVSEYSGGLLQITALLAVETNELTLAQLRLKYYSAKYGLAALPISKEANDNVPVAPAGRSTVKDRDAL
jgi:hypothetical protein